MNLGEFRRSWPEAVIHGFHEVRLTGVCVDSRQVKPGDLFVAVPGTKADGLGFLSDAIVRGAAAVVTERIPAVPPAVPYVVVPDARRAVSRIADLFYGRPTERLTVVGITGTNGKTTTAHLVKSILEAAGRRVGLLGTISYIIGPREIPASNTTPDAIQLHRIFAEMLEAGLDSAVMEVSSHSLVQHRVADVRFAAGIFTNLTRDHLDYHGTLEAYRDAKGLLFRALAPSAVAALNAGDAASATYAGATSARPLRYSVGAGGEVAAEDVSTTLAGNRFTLVTPRGRIAVASPLIGRHNVENVLAAATAMLGLGIDPEAIRRGIEAVRAVRGRLEPVESGQPFRVFVDYAHTNDALENVLSALRPLAARRIITVFGCGGDRDRGKRPLMAAVAERLSDRVILTSDNPRSEDPASILAEISRGFANPAAHEAIVDRAAAIGRAVEIAEPGDVVLIAGKGHETTQTFRDIVKPFDDRHVTQEALARRGWTSRVHE